MSHIQAMTIPVERPDDNANWHHLRGYQQHTVNGVRVAFSQGSRAPLLVLPAGGGKTFTSCYMIDQAQGQGRNVLILVHRQELARQFSQALTAYGVAHGLIMAHERPDLARRVQVASVQTYAKRMGKMSWRPHLIISDEAHHVTEGSLWGRVLENHAGALRMGLTATPIRLDGKGLGQGHGGYFDAIVEGPSPAELMALGNLCDYKMFAPGQAVDMKGVRRTAGDYNRKDAEERINKPTITGNAIEHYRQHADGKPAVVFCMSRRHAEDVCQRFNDAGYRFAVLDGTLRGKGRDDAGNDLVAQRVAALADGRLHGLVTVDLVSEGFDLPAIEVCISLRATQSESLWIQQCLDEKTEILTQRGWVGREDISDDDIVAAFDTSIESIQWEPILSRVDRPLASGEAMYAVSGPHLNIRVTDGHQMIVRGRSGTSKRWIKEDAQAAALRRSMFTVPVSATQEPGHPARLADDELRFLGWFLSDGTHDKSNNVVRIGQSSAKHRHLDSIRRTLRGCGFKFSEYRIKRKGDQSHCPDLVQFQVSRGQPRGRDKHLSGWARLAPWINKSLPEVYESLTRRQLGILLETLNLGDGANGHKSRQGKKAMFITCGDNSVMAERLQSLLVRRGYRCNLSIYQKGDKGPWWSLQINDTQHATIAGTSVKDGRIGAGRQYRRSRFTEVDHAPGERVWCVENALGTLVTRRNGKVAIVGNCARSLRPADGKPYAVILDHVGNSRRHGLPDDDRDWSLAGKKKGKKAGDSESAAPIKQCEACGHVHRPGPPQCPECGEAYETQARKVEEVDGQLEEVKRRADEKRQRKKEIEQAQSLPELLYLAEKYGYKPNWAHIKYRQKLAAQQGKYRGGKPPRHLPPIPPVEVYDRDNQGAAQ